jgi:D-beta-D-heptose 7-phosphate kinase/D-beta-D-heptose 1-phosphate adenosyltransferase
MIESQVTVPQKQLKILLLGDLCTDIYLYGNVDRISPEAPVPIFNLNKEYRCDGMAGNVKNNLEKLGCLVDFEHGTRTSNKTRVIDIKSKQHLLRIDHDEHSKPIRVDYGSLNKYDAIVVSDYNKGSILYDTIRNLKLNYNGPIFVDTKKTDLSEFQGCIVKINQKEFRSAVSYCDDLIVTRGSDQVTYKDEEYDVPQVDVFDVCGAGDTFLAALAYKYCITKNISMAIKFAIKASTITVQHNGVYAPSLEEIENATFGNS